MACDLCDGDGGAVLWRDQHLRVVLVDDADYHGYCRVIWNAHVAEMTDLDDSQRLHLMRVTFAVEAALRELVQPDKINIASLGNFTPHLHWHVIARFRDDAHFPQSIWGARQRNAPPRPDAAGQLRQRLAQALETRLKY
jgi:diadenosine tetraphosphate (Ap4A) HIT family hydrolase